MGVITFNNITSSSLGVEVETFPDYVAPEKEYQVTHVPGRNGDLVVDTKTFQNVPRPYEVSVATRNSETFTQKMNAIAEWLHSASGYARLEDTYEPDYYRMAYYSESVSFENLFNEAGKATLNFICKPQRYLKSGETPVTFTEEGTIQNGTRFSSSPVLKVTTDNTQGSVSIGNHTIAIKAGAGTDQITIDCELQDAWSGITNKNSFIILTDGEFPVIDPGTQTVTFDGGVQSVEVIPRWWTV